MGEDFGDVTACEICSNLCQRKLKKYSVCPGQHVICNECLSSHTFKTHCPICGKPFAQQKSLVGSKFIEMMAWDEVLKLDVNHKTGMNDDGLNGVAVDEKKNEHQNQGTGAVSEQISSASFSLGLPHNFKEFYHADDQSFMGMKIKVSGYMALLGVQFIFTIFNFYFGLKRINEKTCGDHPLQHKVVTYQSWLMGVGIIELAFMVFTLLFIIFYKYRCVNQEEFDKCWNIVKTIFGVKIVLWGVVQMSIFLGGIPSKCVGGLQAFGMITAILHVFLFSAVFAEFGCLRKKLLFIALQFYLAFFNIFYGIQSIDELEPSPEHQESIILYQKWMRGIGLFEICFIVLVTLLYRLKYWGFNTSKFGMVLIVLYAIKLVFWLTVQFYMYLLHHSALQSCSGSIYVYVLVNVLLHVIMVVLVGWRKFKK